MLPIMNDQFYRDFRFHGIQFELAANRLNININKQLSPEEDLAIRDQIKKDIRDLIENSNKISIENNELPNIEWSIKDAEAECERIQPIRFVFQRHWYGDGPEDFLLFAIDEKHDFKNNPNGPNGPNGPNNPQGLNGKKSFLSTLMGYGKYLILPLASALVFTVPALRPVAALLNTAFRALMSVAPAPLVNFASGLANSLGLASLYNQFASYSTRNLVAKGAAIFLGVLGAEVLAVKTKEVLEPCVRAATSSTVNVVTSGFNMFVAQAKVAKNVALNTASSAANHIKKTFGF